MADKKNKKEQEPDISFDSMLWMGIIIVIVNAILGNVIGKYPQWLSNVLYIVGVASLVVYMIQIRFEKRTGQKEVDPTVNPKGKKGKSSSKKKK